MSSKTKEISRLKKWKWFFATEVPKWCLYRKLQSQSLRAIIIFEWRNSSSLEEATKGQKTKSWELLETFGMISKAHWKVFDTHDFFQLADWRRPVRKRHLFQFSCDFTVTEKVFKQLMCNRRRTYAIRRIHTQLFAFINLTFSLPGKTNSISRKIWITTTWFNRILRSPFKTLLHIRFFIPMLEEV